MRYLVGYLYDDEVESVQLTGLDDNDEPTDIVIRDAELAVNGRLCVGPSGSVVYEDVDGDADNKPGKGKDSKKKNESES